MAASIRTLVSQCIPQLKRDTWQWYLITHWSDIVGNLVHHMRLERVEGAQLVVGVYEPQWLQELYMLSNQLVQQCNAALGRSYVSRVRFQLVGFSPTKKKQFSPVGEQKKNTDVSLSDMQKQALEKISDEELREMLKQFYYRGAF